MPAVDGENIYFGDFRLDLRGRRLLCRDREIALRPKAFDVLQYLVEHPGKVIAINELLDACWRDVSVTPNTVSNLIYMLRTIFAEAGGADWIQTVPRHGYRFTAPLHAANSGAARIGATAPREVNLRDEEPHHELDRFVGRSRELAFLEQRWKQAVRGIPATIFITGEAGMGKTSIVRRFCAQAEPQPLLCVGRCLPHQGEPEPYMPVLEALGSLGSTSELREIVRAQAPTWLSQMPWLVSPDERGSSSEAPAGSGGRMLREGKRLFAALAEERPLVLVVEDVHWADGATVDLLRALAEDDRDTRRLLLATYRPSEVVVRDHPLRNVVSDLTARANNCEVLSLASLTPALVREYLQRRFENPAWAAELAPRLEDRSGGNPLFLDAMTTLLCEQRRIVQQPEGWVLSAAISDIEVNLPEGLREMIRARVRRLPADSGPILEAAAAAGMDFTTLEIAAALEMAPPMAAQACEALAAAAHIIHLVGEITWPDGSVGEIYRFAHAAYRETVANDIPPSRRRLLHGRIGERLAAAFGQRAREIAPRLADHFGAAGDWARQLEFLEHSVWLASGRYAHREAVAYVDHFLEVLARTPAGDERDAKELGCYLERSRMLMDWQGYAAAHDSFVRVVELSRQQNNRLFEFFGHVGCCLSGVMGHLADTSTNADAMLAIAADGHPELAALAHAVAGSVRDSVGDPAGAVVHGDAALAALPYALPGVPRGFDTETLVRVLLQSTLGRLGRLARSRDERQLAIQGAEERSDLLGKAHTFAFLACDALVAAEPDVALELARRSIESARAGDFEVVLAAGEAAYEAAQIALAPDDGIDPASVERLGAAIEKRRRSKERWHNVEFAGYLADAYRRRGDLAAARAEIDGFFTGTDTVALAELWRIKGLIAQDAASSGSTASRKRGHAEAANCFQSAIALARRQNTKLFELRSQIALTRLRQGEDATRDALAALVESFAIEGASADVAEANLLLAKLSQKNRSVS